MYLYKEYYILQKLNLCLTIKQPSLLVLSNTQCIYNHMNCYSRLYLRLFKSSSIHLWYYFAA